MIILLHLVFKFYFNRIAFKDADHFMNHSLCIEPHLRQLLNKKIK